MARTVEAEAGRGDGMRCAKQHVGARGRLARDLNGGQRGLHLELPLLVLVLLHLLLVLMLQLMELVRRRRQWDRER